MPRMKSVIAGLLLVIICVALVTAVWMFSPVSVDQAEQDPAVVHANADVAPGKQLQEAYFEHDGLNLHYIEAGKGNAETVIFIHGFPSFWYSFLRQVENFKTDYHVVAIDGLGAGKSDAPLASEPYKLEAMAKQLNALIDHIGAEKVHLVGHDWGSAFAIGFAQRYPDRVLTVTGISAPPTNASLDILRSDAKSRETAKYVERFKSANPALILALGVGDSIYDGAYRPLVEAGKLTQKEGDLFRNATSNPRRIDAHINWYRANIPSPDDITEADLWPSRDARVTVPSLYIWGENDQIYSQPAIDRMMSLSDDAELVLFPDVGHWPHVREAEAVNAAIGKHLSTQTSSK